MTPAEKAAELPTWTLLQWKHAIRLEERTRHLPGKPFPRSVRLHAAKNLGMPGRPKAAKVLEVIDAELAQREDGSGLTARRAQPIRRGE